MKICPSHTEVHYTRLRENSTNIVERERQRERETHTHTERQRQRETERDRDRPKEKSGQKGKREANFQISD